MRVAEPVSAAPFDYPPHTTIPSHQHAVHQLVYAARGVMRVRTARGDWVVPPNRALWVPAGTEHEIRTLGNVQMRTLYIEPRAVGDVPGGCAVVSVAPLLRELILRLIQVEVTQQRDAEHLIVGLILHDLRLLETEPLHVALPNDERLRRICEAIAADAGSDLTCEAWAARFGLSAKTLARDFGRGLGTTFGRWRQQVRLLAALERLACGEPIAVVALDLGYRNPSSFSAMFRRALGTTPSAYFS